MSFKDDVSDVNSRLVDLEGRARKLRNQHLADLIGHTVGRLSDAMKHPDMDNVDRVHEGKEELEPASAPLNSGGNLQFAAGDPGVALQAEEKARREAFARDAVNRDRVTGQPLLTPFGGNPVSSSDPDAHHPGDPEFVAAGKGAMEQNPNDVNLNADGTLKQAPGVKGTSDDRDKA